MVCRLNLATRDMLIKNPVVLKSPHRSALGQEQGRPKEATRGSQNRARSAPHTEDSRRRFVEAAQDVRTTDGTCLISFPPLFEVFN